MPAKSESQMRLFSMALAVRHGKLKRSDVGDAVLDIVDSDMTDAEIKDFTKMKTNTNESFKMTKLSHFVSEIPYSDCHVNNIDVTFRPESVFVVIKPGSTHLTSTIINIMKRNNFTLYKIRPKKLRLNEAKSLYRVHEKEEFYNDLCRYMSSGISVGILFNYKGTGDKFKKMSEVKELIRDKYSESDMRNVIHSSDNDDSMKSEMLKYFTAM